MSADSLATSRVMGRRAYEEAAQRLVDLISSGDVRRGDRLPAERRLAEQFGVSRATIRGAIGLLRSKGVLEVRPGSSGGSFVAVDHVQPDLVGSPEPLDPQEIPGLFEARRLLEPRVAQLAALYGKPRDWAALADIIEQQRAVKDDGQRYIDLDIVFHQMIARATGNSTIVELTRTLLQRLAPTMRDLVMHGPPPGPEESIEITERTLRAIQSGDPDAVERAMMEHLGGLERLWELKTGNSLRRRAPDFLRADFG